MPRGCAWHASPPLVLLVCLACPYRPLLPQSIHRAMAQLDYRRMAQGSSLGARRVTPAEAALVTAVLGTGAAQSELLPALMAAYAHADHVVGLDVDKDQVCEGRVWVCGCACMCVV